jgi:hypothetical protein
VAQRRAFILSSGRTGTKFLARYFDLNFEGVVGRHEPPSSRLLGLAFHARRAGLPAERFLRLLLERKRRQSEEHGDSLYIESNPYLSGCFYLIGGVWGEVTIIHVVRDPRDTVRSAINHGMSRGLKGAANRLLSFGHPKGRHHRGAGGQLRWIDRGARTWVLFNSLIRRHGGIMADYHLIHFENIFDSSCSGLRHLCDLFGLEYRDEDAPLSPRERVNPGRLDIMPPWREWTAAQCLALHHRCTPLMEEFGYGGEDEWLERIGANE